MIKKIYVITIFFLLGCICSCKKNDENDPTPGIRKEIISAITENVIIANYQNLSLQSDSLKTVVEAFNNNATAENLSILRNKWKKTAIAWKKSEQFDFGPGETLVMLDTEIGTWPINTALINNEIATNTVLGEDFIAKTGSTRKGIYALEYLIYGNDEQILANFTNDTKAAIRKKYLALLASEINKNSNLVYQQWINGYKDEFVKATGLDEGSALSIILNKMVENLEIVINKQIGNPIGKKNSTDNGTLRPNEVEAIYSQESIALTLASLDAIKAVFTADNLTKEGKGFDSYVSYLQISSNGAPLENLINAQLENFRLAVNAIPPPLKTSVNSNTETVNTAWKEGKKLLILMKNDLPVNIGIQINFNSNDGD